MRSRTIRAHHAELQAIAVGMPRDEVVARLGPASLMQACRELPEWEPRIDLLARGDGDVAECGTWRNVLHPDYTRVVCFDRGGRVVVIAAEST